MLEALSVGRAVLASDIDGNRSLVTDGATGLLFRDEAEFERRAELLPRDPALRERLGRAGAALVAERFWPAREIDGYCASTTMCSRPVVGFVTPASRAERPPIEQRRLDRRFARHGRLRARGFRSDSALSIDVAIGRRLAAFIE